jgi:hypothetical protein
VNYILVPFTKVAWVDLMKAVTSLVRAHIIGVNSDDGLHS